MSQPKGKPSAAILARWEAFMETEPTQAEFEAFLERLSDLEVDAGVGVDSQAWADLSDDQQRRAWLLVYEGRLSPAAAVAAAREGGGTA